MKTLLSLLLVFIISTSQAMVKSSGTGPFTIPTAPSIGTSTAQSSSANTFGSYVQTIASTSNAIYITGVTVSLASGTNKPSYVNVQIGTGASGSETTVGQIQIVGFQTSGVTGDIVGGIASIFPAIPVATSTRIALKTASDVASALAWNVSLQCINQSNIVDSGINESANATQINGVNTTSVTTVNANIGETQPLNFTGTGSSALVKGDVTDIATAAVSTSTAQLGVNAVNWAGGAIPAPNVTGVPKADVVDFLGTASAGAAGYAAPDWGHVNAATTTLDLSGTTVKNVDNAIANVTTVTTATTCTTCTNLTNAATAGDFTATMKTSLNNATPTVVLSAADSGVVQKGTAAAGGASTITLASALGADSLPNGERVKITSGTGAGQTRGIVGYVDSTKVVTVDRAWTTNPDATSVYAILFGSSPKIDSSEQVTSASVQGNVTGSVGSVTGAVGSVTGAVGSVTAGVTVTTNNDKTGYSLTQSFPTNFSSLSIDASGRIDLGKILGTASAGTAGYAAIDWAHISAPTTSQDLSGTTIKNVDNAIANVTTVATTTNLTNLPSIPANWITAAGITAGALNGKGDWLTSSGYTAPPSAATIATTIFEDTTAGGDFGTAGSIGLLLVNDINATISSRLATSGYTVPPTTAAIATGIFTDSTAGSDFSTGGSIGALFVADLNAAIGSRMATYTQPTGFLSATFPSGTIANTTNITAGTITTATNLTTNNDKTGYSLTVTPPTAAQNATAIWQDLTAGLDFGTSGSIGLLLATDINATVSSRSTYSGGDTSGTTTLLTRIPSDVWDEVLSGHLTSGTTGAALNASGGAGDPWSTSLPGSYGAGTAGYIVGNNLNASVSSRLPTSSYATPPSVSAITDAVWDEPISGHLTAGSTGNTLNGAGGGGVDPWSILLPGSYGIGTAGYILGTSGSTNGNLSQMIENVGGPRFTPHALSVAPAGRRP